MHLLAFLLLLLNPLAADSVVVRTDAGFIKGLRENGIYRFQGIPYAAPPVGTLRWKPPASPTPWSDTLRTAAFCSKCAQKDFEQGQPDSTARMVGKEDCLYLNVWSPSLIDSNRAVMVWIHGGGNQQGSASDSSGGTPMFDGMFFASRESVVVVTINYRLGPLGYLAHPGLDAETPGTTSGNYGLLDQIKALTWVQKNIARFGGDRHNVTIFGESAGAVDVTTLLTLPAAAGLFHRTISQSGTPHAATYAERIATSKGLASQLGLGGLTDAAQINAMRQVPSDSLVKYLTNPTANAIIDTEWGPVIDGVLVTKDPWDIIAAGQHNRVPALLGSNADETAVMAPPTVTPLQFQVLVAAGVPQAYRARAYQLYPPGSTNTEARASYVKFTTDVSFTSPARRMARALSTSQTEPVWRYFFTHHIPGPAVVYGAFHGAEIFYAFNSLENTSVSVLLTQNDRAVLAAMRSSWAQFARTGNPNLASQPAWTQYNAAADPYQTLAPVVVAGNGLRTAECNFLDSLRVLTSIDEAPAGVVGEFALLPNYPNPFNPATTIRVALPVRATLTLAVFDVTGALVTEVTNGEFDAGIHEFQWDGTTRSGRAVASGVYMVRMSAAVVRGDVRGFHVSRKILLLR